MKIISQNDDGSVVLELTRSELVIIHNIGHEFTGGNYRLNKAEWDASVLGGTHEEATKVFNDLTDITSRAGN